MSDFCVYNLQGELVCDGGNTALETFKGDPRGMYTAQGSVEGFDGLTPQQAKFLQLASSKPKPFEQPTWLTYLQQHGRRRLERFDAAPKVDCQVSNWSGWGPCVGNSVSNCNGLQVRTRSVSQPNTYGGKGCPSLVDQQRCDVNPSQCFQCPSSDQTYLTSYSKNIRGQYKTGWDHYNKVGRTQGYVYNVCSAPAPGGAPASR